MHVHRGFFVGKSTATSLDSQKCTFIIAPTPPERPRSISRGRKSTSLFQKLPRQMACKVLSFLAIFSNLVVSRVQLTRKEGPVIPREVYAFYIDDDAQPPSLKETEVCDVKLCASREESLDDCDIAHLMTIKTPSVGHRVDIDLESHLGQDSRDGQ